MDENKEKTLVGKKALLPTEFLIGITCLAIGFLGGWIFYSYTYTASIVQLAPSTIPTPSTSPATAVIVYTPDVNAYVSSPLVVKGKITNDWVFEGTFPVRILDANRKEIGSQPASAQGDWTVVGMLDFSANVTFSQPTTTTGFLVISNDNPSGLPENNKAYEVPIRFIL